MTHPSQLLQAQPASGGHAGDGARVAAARMGGGAAMRRRSSSSEMAPRRRWLSAGRRRRRHRRRHRRRRRRRRRRSRRPSVERGAAARMTPQQRARAQESKAAALQRRAEVAELRAAAARRRQWRRMERRRARAERWPELVARARRWRRTAPAVAGPVLNGPATRRRVGHRMVVRPRAAALAAWARRVRRRGRRAAQHDEQADSPARDATMCSSPRAASRDNAGVAGDSVQQLWWRRQRLLRLPPQLRSGVARAARSDCEGMKHASAR